MNSSVVYAYCHVLTLLCWVSLRWVSLCWVFFAECCCAEVLGAIFWRYIHGYWRIFKVILNMDVKYFNFSVNNKPFWQMYVSLCWKKFYKIGSWWNICKPFQKAVSTSSTSLSNLVSECKKIFFRGNCSNGVNYLTRFEIIFERVWQIFSIHHRNGFLEWNKNVSQFGKRFVLSIFYCVVFDYCKTAKDHFMQCKDETSKTYDFFAKKASFDKFTFFITVALHNGK